MSIKTYREEKGEIIPGVVLYAYIRNAGYHLDEIIVYRDGMVDCWGLVTFEGFVQKVQQRWVVTDFKAGTRISLPFMAPGDIAVLQTDTQEDEADFVKEVHDRINELNGRPNSLAEFHAAAEAWQQSRDDHSFTVLRQAWAAMSKWGLNEHYASDWLTSEEWHELLSVETIVA